MGSEKLCICDRTRQNLVNLDVVFIDTVKLPFTQLVCDLSDISKNGLWLNPFRGFPKLSGFSRFDVIYLDKGCKVIESARNFSEPEFKPLPTRIESALVLPAHSLSLIAIHPGDQFRICRAPKVLAGGIESWNHREPSVDETRCFRGLAVCGATLPVLQMEQQPETLAPTREITGEKRQSSRPRMGILSWLFAIDSKSTDRRRGIRIPDPELVAYYWTGGAPSAYRLGNVSESGLYLLTNERWSAGTRILMTLQRENGDGEKFEDVWRVESEVVRWGDDGVGFKFVENGFVDLNTGEIDEGKKFERGAFLQFLNATAKLPS